MKIAIIGGGGREHAIYTKLKNEIGIENIFLIGDNGGINNSIKPKSYLFEDIYEIIKKNKIDTIIPGSETYFADGITDYFERKGVKVFGPTKKGAKLESSKIFAKKFMDNFNIPTPNWKNFSNVETGLKYIKKRYKDRFVIKYDALAGGKGSYICNSFNDGVKVLDIFLKKYGKNFKYIVEDYIEGKEISIITVFDGENSIVFPPSRDYKPALDGDKGKNGGGMGTFTPVFYCDKDILKVIETKIINPTIKGIKNRGIDYKGFIYFGITLSKDGPYLLEYNVRMGDPEGEVLLLALKSKFSDIVKATFNKNLKNYKADFEKKYIVDVVLVSEGYPESYKTGYRIEGIDKVDKDIVIFHSGTQLKDNILYSSGGRVLNVVAKGDSLKEAVEKVYKNCKKIEFENMFYRKDIGIFI